MKRALRAADLRDLKDKIDAFLVHREDLPWVYEIADMRMPAAMHETFDMLEVLERMLGSLPKRQ